MSEQINMNNSNNPTLLPIDFFDPIGQMVIPHRFVSVNEGTPSTKWSLSNFTPRTTATNDIGVEPDKHKHTAINKQIVFVFFCPVKRINFWKFEEWNIVLAYLLAMEGSNTTPYEPDNKNDATRHLRAMEGSSNKTPYEPKPTCLPMRRTCPPMRPTCLPMTSACPPMHTVI